jgi:hypothetical protein
MKKPRLVLLLISISIGQPLYSQSVADSAKVATTLQALFHICKTIDFTDPQINELGTFYKAAPYIIYRGEDKKRAWKDFANYKQPSEKEGVDNICFRINGSVNQDSLYKITRYFTQKETEGTWHILLISWQKKGIPKETAFAFLKINNRFGLGDID